MKRWSLDARSKGQPWPLPERRGIENRKGPSAWATGTSRRAVGGQVRRLREMGDQSGPILERK